MRLLAALVFVTVAAWGFAAASASYWWGEPLLPSALAAGLCLGATAVTLLWGLWCTNRSPEQQVVFTLGATGLRMFGVLLGGLFLSAWLPQLGDGWIFWKWLLCFYLFTLATEVVLLGLNAALQSAKRDLSGER